MKGNFLVFLCLLSGSCRLDAGVIAQWNFNSLVPDADVSTGSTLASQGSGYATAIGGITWTFVTGDTRHDPAGTIDNSAWRTTKYPAATGANKSAGVRFDVDTTG